MNFWSPEFKRPLVFLAPMDGYTNRAYREIVKLIEPRVITVCEFVSADAIAYGSKKTLEKIAFDPDMERPYVVQVFGKNLDNFKKATDFLIEYGVDGIDINMGCPARTVVKSEHGSALRKNIDLAQRVAEAVCSTAGGRVPVSVKTRLGWEDSSDLIDFGRRMETSGVAGLTIHGRTYSQAFSGRADWSAIYELKKNLTIPVIGNGDVDSGKTALELIGNLDGVMVGRATFGNPWVMGDISHTLLGSLPDVCKPVHTSFLYDPDKDYSYFPNKLGIILEHGLRLSKYKDRYGMFEFRKNLLSYVRGFNGAKEYRSKLVTVETVEDINSVLNEIIDKEFNQSLSKC